MANFWMLIILIAMVFLFVVTMVQNTEVSREASPACQEWFYRRIERTDAMGCDVQRCHRRRLTQFLLCFVVPPARQIFC